MFLAIVALLTFFPFYFMVITSLKSTSQMRHYFLTPVLPLHFDNYVVAFWQLTRYFLNTLVVTGVSVPGVLLLSSLTAFAFARYAFPGKTVLFYAIISLLMVPGVLTLVPAFIWIKQLGLLNTYWALIFPYIASGQVFGIYLLRGSLPPFPSSCLTRPMWTEQTSGRSSAASLCRWPSLCSASLPSSTRWARGTITSGRW